MTVFPFCVQVSVIIPGHRQKQSPSHKQFVLWWTAPGLFQKSFSQSDLQGLLFPLFCFYLPEGLPVYPCVVATTFMRLILVSCKHFTHLVSLLLSMFLFPTPLSIWRFCHHGVLSHSRHSDPPPSRASGCCQCGPAAPSLQFGSGGPLPRPDFSTDRHNDLQRCSSRDNPPRSKEKHKYDHSKESKMIKKDRVYVCIYVSLNCVVFWRCALKIHSNMLVFLS